MANETLVQEIRQYRIYKQVSPFGPDRFVVYNPKGEAIENWATFQAAKRSVVMALGVTR